MKRYFQNENGGMLVYTLLVFLIFTILGVSLMTYTYSDVKLSQVDRKQQGAFYIAEAGANQAFHSIKEEIYLKHEAAPNKEVFFSTLQAYIDTNWRSETVDDFEEQFGANPSAQVKVEQTGADPYTFQIQSTGKIDGQERIVTKPFTVNYRKGESTFPNLPEGVAGIFRDSATLNEGASITGNVYLLSESSETVKVTGGSNIGGTLYVPGSAIDSVIHPDTGHWINIIKDQLADGYNQSWYDQHIVSIIDEFPDPVIPNLFAEDIEVIAKNGNNHNIIENGVFEINGDIAEEFTLEVTEDTFLDSITIKNDTTLNIDTKNNNINLFVNKLDMPQGKLNILGHGTVNLYVQNTFKIYGNDIWAGGSSININGNTNQLNVIFSGDDTLVVGGGQRLNANILTKNANVTLTSGGNYEGYIISGGSNLTLNGGAFSNAVIIAPFSEVILNNGARVSGLIVGKKYVATGGTNLAFSSRELPPLFSNGDGGGDIIESEPTIEIE